MSGTPGAGPSPVTGEADHQKGAEPPRPRHCNIHPLGRGALWHPWKQSSGPSGDLGPRRKRKHSHTAAIHLGLE